MKNILFNFSNGNQFNELYKLAAVLKVNKYNLVFLLDENEGAFDKELIQTKITQINGIVNTVSENIFSIEVPKVKFPLLWRIKNKFFLPANGIKNNFNYHLYQKKVIETITLVNKFEKYLSEKKIQLLIIAEDGIGSNYYLIKAAVNRKIKCLCIPYEYSGVKQLIQGAERNIRYEKGHFPKLFTRILKKTYFEREGFYYGFLPFENIMALYKTKTLPPDIKTVHGGYSDKLAAESQMMRKHYISEKISQRKIVLTGSMNDELLSKSINESFFTKEKIYKQFKFNPDLKLLSVSFVPDYSYKNLFTDYFEYASFIISSLKKLKNFNVVYQFHPRVQQDKLNLIKSSFDIAVSDLATIDLIPASDLFVASYTSTIRWAIASGVPVVNLDVFGFDYDDFKMCKGVADIKSKQGFLDYISLLDSEQTELDKLSKYQFEDSGKWAILDGKSTGRLLNLVGTLCQN